MTRPAGLMPARPGAGAPIAMRARWSGSAPARPRPARSGHRHASSSARHVASRVLRQVAQRPHVVDRLGPARVLVVDRRRARERRAARRPRVDASAVDLVGDAQAQSVDPGQDVELVEHDRADAVDRDGVPQRDDIEPADPARTARSRCRTRCRARRCPCRCRRGARSDRGPTRRASSRPS